MEHGLSYYKAERYADVIATFDRLIQLTLDYAGAYFNKGNALVGMGRFEEAVAAYDQAIRLAPKVADVYTAKGRTLESLGWARVHDRDCADAIFYVLRTGCQWQVLDQTELCAHSTAHDRFQEWVEAGEFLTMWAKGRMLTLDQALVEGEDWK